MLLLTPISKGLELSECIKRAGEKYRINPLLLYSIALVESGMNPNALNVNRNGTRDIGMFQINEDNLKRLNISIKYAYNPCTASFIAGYLLNDCVRMFGESFRAIDCYNKGVKAKKESSYVLKVIRTYKRLKR